MENYPDAADEIKAWIGIVEKVRWHNPVEVRSTLSLTSGIIDTGL
jgi:mRNA-degrading endonuclease HigB of HigAB toxin-antitoxin module